MAPVEVGSIAPCASRHEHQEDGWAGGNEQRACVRGQGACVRGCGYFSTVIYDSFATTNVKVLIY